MRALRTLAVVAIVSASTNIGWTCCLAFASSNPMSLVRERAVIVWDAGSGIEHFVRQTSFGGEARDFGFIVPTPTKPEVAEAKIEAFYALEALIPRETAGSELLDQYTVGDYEVSILQATDGKSMLDWLAKNGYDSRPAMQEWLDHYAKMKWYFAALKFVRPEDSTAPETKAVRVSFKTDVPFYPYKMPSDTWPAGHVRPLALYFISDGVARAKYRDNAGEWDAKVQWSGPVPPTTAESVATSLGLKPEDVPPGSTMTVFVNGKNAVGYDHDLYFVTYMTVLPTWVVLIVLLFVVGGVVYLLLCRKRGAKVGL